MSWNPQHWAKAKKDFLLENSPTWRDRTPQTMCENSSSQRTVSTRVSQARPMVSVFNMRKLGPGESSAVCEKVSKCGRSFMSDSLWPCGLYPTRPLWTWNSPARILERVVIPFSRGIFLTQGLDPSLLHCRQILYHLSHLGNLGKPPKFTHLSKNWHRNLNL